MTRYAAKLLFQFRVVVDGDSAKRRLCEERIVVLEAECARKALALAKRKARKALFRYANSEGNPVHFEFVGVIELMSLGAESDEDEVWYEIVERLLPMERREKLIPPESALNAIRNEASGT